ncbi:MAG: GAF domain-containing protein [Anaerolineae bacterium]|jgi:GAF domain-containing protein|nr:GAF domain-containing protein [Anaerolineae bacterium]
MSTNTQPTQDPTSNGDKRFRGTVITSTLILMVTIIAALTFDLIHRQMGRNILMFTIALLLVSLMLVFSKNFLLPARIITPTATFLLLSYFLIEGEGVRDATVVGLPAVALLAGLLLGGRGAIIFGIITTLVIAGISYAELNHYLVTPVSSFLDTKDAGIFTILNLSTALITTFLIRRLNQAAEAAKTNEKTQIEANKELNILKSTLEKQVDERTLALKTTATELENRAQQLQAIADVARASSLIKNVKELLPTISQQIRQTFNFYHVGIFLLNVNKTKVILEASSNRTENQMLQDRYELGLGKGSIVGHVAQDGISRIVRDVEFDPNYLAHADLLETRTEIAIPLKYGSEIIGVLDIQSEKEAAFTHKDDEVFRTLANQVAIAIENARQYEITKAALEQSEELSRLYVQQEWSRISQTEELTGYRYTKGSTYPLSKEEAKSASKGSMLRIPVKLRDEIIGIFKIRMRDTEKEYKSQDVELISAIANRAAIAMENARLLEDSKRRAVRESIIGNISTKIGASIQMDTIIQTTVQELGETLGNSAVSFRLANSSENRTLEAKENNKAKK